MGKKNVKIEVNGMPVADPDPLKWVLKSDRDYIEWRCDDPFEITLHYPEDFENTRKVLVSSVKNGRHRANTGPVAAGAPIDVDRKYDILANGKLADPDYRVRP